MAGEAPQESTTGEYGFTSSQVRSLLDCSDGTARKLCPPTLMSRSGVQLAPHEVVRRVRQDLLLRLRARELDPADEAQRPAAPDGDAVATLQERVMVLEERLRLISAARAAAREGTRMALAEEDAYLQGMTLDLRPPR